MSKKHFIALADALRDQRPTGGKLGHFVAEFEQYERDVMAVAKVCQSMNRKFKPKLWLAYLNGECGPSGGELKTAKVKGV